MGRYPAGPRPRGRFAKLAVSVPHGTKKIRAPLNSHDLARIHALIHRGIFMKDAYRLSALSDEIRKSGYRLRLKRLKSGVYTAKYSITVQKLVVKREKSEKTHPRQQIA